MSDNSNKPESGLWKDYINRRSIETFAKQIGRNYDKFDQSAFVDDIVSDNFSQFELKERISAISDGLKKYLPPKYSQAITIIKKTAPHVGSFENWALMSFIEFYGLEHFDLSVNTMRDLTCFSSAEFAIRPYMIKYTDKMLLILSDWAESDNEHIRRLAAEASRPRGVWVAHIEAFKNNPRPVIKILEKLKADPSLYVRKAVANNLNDISKDNPDILIRTALKWKMNNNQHTDWILKRACRSLIKDGYPDVYPIFDFTINPDVEISEFKIQAGKFKIGQDMIFSFFIKSLSKINQKLAVDYKVYYRKKNGVLSPKVFKLTEKPIRPGEIIALDKKHSFKNFTTRTHYPGKHRMEIIINGLVKASRDFSIF